MTLVDLGYLECANESNVRKKFWFLKLNTESQVKFTAFAGLQICKLDVEFGSFKWFWYDYCG